MVNTRVNEITNIYIRTASLIELLAVPNHKLNVAIKLLEAAVLMCVKLTLHFGKIHRDFYFYGIAWSYLVCDL